MNISFRPVTLDDVSFVSELYKHPDIYRQAVLQDQEITPELISQWVKRWLTHVSHMHFIVLDEDGNPIGLSQIFAIDKLERVCELGYLLMPAVQGKGLFQKLHEHQVQIAREVLGVQKLIAQTVSFNTHSQHLLKKFGFIQENVRKKCIYRNDEFHDIIQYAKLLA